MRFGIVLFAKAGFGIGSSGVEVTQRDPPEAVRLPIPAQHALREQLRLAIRINRRLEVVFGNRDPDWTAVGSAG